MWSVFLRWFTMAEWLTRSRATLGVTGLRPPSAVFQRFVYQVNTVCVVMPEFCVSDDNWWKITLLPRWVVIIMNTRQAVLSCTARTKRWWLLLDCVLPIASLGALSVWLAQLAKAQTRAVVCSITQYYRCPWLKYLDRQLDSGFILPGSVKWVPASAGVKVSVQPWGWRVMYKSASGAISFRNWMCYSAHCLSIVKWYHSSCVMMTPVYKSPWFKFNFFIHECL